MPKTSGSMTETLRKFFKGNINASLEEAQAELKREHGREVSSGLIYGTRNEVRTDLERLKAAKQSAKKANAPYADKKAVPAETLDTGKNALMKTVKSGPAGLYMISAEDVSAVVSLAERFGGMRPLGQFVGALLGNE